MTLRLDLVVGPNGAGKTTFVRFTLAPAVPGTTFVNADEIAKRRWPQDPSSQSYAAAKVAAETRARLIRDALPFIAETVFSHPSKLDVITDARAAGYTVFLHVLLVPEDLAVARVQYRVAAGGHSVPEHKIRERYRRLWSLVAEAIGRADTVTVYDSSRHGGPRVVARFSSGTPVGSTTWPQWTPVDLRECCP